MFFFSLEETVISVSAFMAKSIFILINIRISNYRITNIDITSFTPFCQAGKPRDGLIQYVFTYQSCSTIVFKMKASLRN